jgi:hypothetical protein
MRYVVETPIDHPEYALDTVTMTDAKEFSQFYLGETILSHRVVSQDEVIALCDQDNDYVKTWNDQSKLDAFVTYEKDLPK